MIKRLSTAATILAASAGPAFAHLDPAEHGSFVAGISHPLFGADHILAMVAVGLWAALLAQRSARADGRRALLMVPAAFVGTMALGFAAALIGAPVPLAEPVILASVVVIGLFAAVALAVPTVLAMIIVGFFALFHGHAHGAELGAAEALPYFIGFVLSTTVLHGTGIWLGLGLSRVFGGDGGSLATRLAGAAAALGGLWLALGA